MKIEITQARNYPFGSKLAGEVVEVDDGLGEQLIRQGLARAPGLKKKTMVEKTQPRRPAPVEVKPGPVGTEEE